MQGMRYSVDLASTRLSCSPNNRIITMHISARLKPSAESQILFAARASRVSLLVKNDTQHHLLLGLDRRVSADAFDATLAPDAEWSAPANYAGAITFVIDASKNPVKVKADAKGHVIQRSELVSGVEIY